MVQGTCIGQYSSKMSRRPCEKGKEPLPLQGTLRTGAIWLRRTLLCLISLAFPLRTLDDNAQPVVSVSKNSENKSHPLNPPITFTHGTRVCQPLFLQVSRDPPREIETVSITGISTPFLQSLQPESSRISSSWWVVEIKMSAS